MEVACNGDKDEENVSLCVTKTIKRAVFGYLYYLNLVVTHRIEKKVGRSNNDR